jgi:predicted component of type VI protein secretion system
MLDVEGIAEIQGRFHYDQGFFWIESVIDNDAVQVDDLKLERGQIVPLRQGMRVRLGDQDYRVGIEA